MPVLSLFTCVLEGLYEDSFAPLFSFLWRAFSIHEVCWCHPKACTPGLKGEKKNQPQTIVKSFKYPHSVPNESLSSLWLKLHSCGEKPVCGQEGSQSQLSRGEAGSWVKCFKITMWGAFSKSSHRFSWSYCHFSTSLILRKRKKYLQYSCVGSWGIQSPSKVHVKDWGWVWCKKRVKCSYLEW